MAALNVNMVTTSWAAEDNRHVEDLAKKTRTTQRKIAQMKRNVQTVKKIPPLSQDLLTSTKERGKYL